MDFSLFPGRFIDNFLLLGHRGEAGAVEVLGGLRRRLLGGAAGPRLAGGGAGGEVILLQLALLRRPGGFLSRLTASARH